MHSSALTAGILWAKFHSEIRRTCDSMCRSSSYRKWLILMVPTTTFVNKITALGYTLNDETKRVRIFRKKGSDPPHYIPVRKCDKLEDDFVKSALRQAGLTQADIEQFVSDYK
jgi:hypothetical protein